MVSSPDEVVRFEPAFFIDMIEIEQDARTRLLVTPRKEEGAPRKEEVAPSRDTGQLSSSPF